MSIYRPTWLYVKQHTETGLKYFGKTVRDPNSYNGSGTYWKRHLKKHGSKVQTIWTKLFDSQQELTEFALKFSEEHDITESNEWANLRPEDGLDGGNLKGINKGIKRSEKTKRLIAKINSVPLIERFGVEKAAAIARKKSESSKGRKFTAAQRQKSPYCCPLGSAVGCVAALIAPLAARKLKILS